MALLFSNMYPKPVWITFAYYDSSCGQANQNFRKLGWWQVNTCQIFNAWNVDLQTVNRYAYFYAESANDGTNWHGTGNGWLEVNPESGFNQCAFDNAGDSQWVDFIQLDFTWAPPGWDLLGIIGPNPGEVNYAAQKITG